MQAMRNLAARMYECAESNHTHSRKDLRSQFRRTISVAVLFIFLLVMAGLANCQTPAAYEFVGGSDNWGTIDLATGAFSQTGNTGALLTGLGVGPGGLLYGGLDASGTLYQVNPANGNLTTVGTSSVAYNDFGSTTDGVYALDTSLNLYSVNTTTGATTLIGPTGLKVNSTIGLSTGSETLYFTDGPTAILYSINTSTGAATEIGSTGIKEIGALVYENGTLYAGSNSPSAALYT